jgi:XTP/dITP diphosphohydrolase
VFQPDAPATDIDQLTVDWERRKVEEKGRSSVMDGIPGALPALAFAAKVQKKAASQDAAWRDLVAPDDDPWVAQVLELVDQARLAGIDPEAALRRAVQAMVTAFNAEG